MRANNERFL